MRGITSMQSQWSMLTREGASLNIRDCKGGYFSADKKYALAVMGNTEDTKCVKAGTKIRCMGENIFAYPLTVPSYQPKGISVTDNGDGSFTVNGTISQASNIEIAYHMPLYVQPEDIITLSTEVLGGSVEGVSSYLFYSLFTSDNKNFLRNSDKSYVPHIGVVNVTGSIAISENGYNIYIQCGDAGYTFKDFRVRFCISKGSVPMPYQPSVLSGELTLPCDLYFGDTWYPTLGVIERSGGGCETVEPQSAFAAVGTVNIMQQPTELCATLRAALPTRR